MKWITTSTFGLELEAIVLLPPGQCLTRKLSIKNFYYRCALAYKTTLWCAIFGCCLRPIGSDELYVGQTLVEQEPISIITRKLNPINFNFILLMTPSARPPLEGARTPRWGRLIKSEDCFVHLIVLGVVRLRFIPIFCGAVRVAVRRALKLYRTGSKDNGSEDDD